jgi:hypothetical protein
MLSRTDSTENVFLRAEVSVALPEGKQINAKFARVFFFRGSSSRPALFMNSSKDVELNNKKYRVRCTVEVEELK